MTTGFVSDIVLVFGAAMASVVIAAWADSRTRRSATSREVCLISGVIVEEVNLELMYYTCSN